MGLYLGIALVSLEGSIRRMFFCMFMFMMTYDMYMKDLHIVDTICWVVHLWICFGLYC